MLVKTALTIRALLVVGANNPALVTVAVFVAAAASVVAVSCDAIVCFSCVAMFSLETCATEDFFMFIFAVVKKLLVKIVLTITTCGIVGTNDAALLLTVVVVVVVVVATPASFVEVSCVGIFCFSCVGLFFLEAYATEDVNFTVNVSIIFVFAVVNILLVKTV